MKQIGTIIDENELPLTGRESTSSTPDSARAVIRTRRGVEPPPDVHPRPGVF